MIERNQVDQMNISAQDEVRKGRHGKREGAKELKLWFGIGGEGDHLRSSSRHHCKRKEERNSKDCSSSLHSFSESCHHSRIRRVREMRGREREREFPVIERERETRLTLISMVTSSK